MQADKTGKEPAGEESTQQSRRDYILIIAAALIFLILPLFVAAWALSR